MLTNTNVNVEESSVLSVNSHPVRQYNFIEQGTDWVNFSIHRGITILGVSDDGLSQTFVTGAS